MKRTLFIALGVLLLVGGWFRGPALAQQVINGYRIFANVAAPSTPAAGTTAVYTDSSTKLLCGKDDAGVVSCVGGGGFPTATMWYSPANTVATTMGVGVTNATRLWGLYVPYSITTSSFCYDVITTDNSANLYDIGIYNSSGTLLVHTTATAGTTLFSGIGYKCANWTASGTVSGKVYLGLTGNAATAVLGGASSSANANFCSSCIPTANNTTTGATLNGTVTPPADSWAAGTMPNIQLH